MRTKVYDKNTKVNNKKAHLINLWQNLCHYNSTNTFLLNLWAFIPLRIYLKHNNELCYLVTRNELQKLIFFVNLWNKNSIFLLNNNKCQFIKDKFVHERKAWKISLQSCFLLKQNKIVVYAIILEAWTNVLFMQIFYWLPNPFLDIECLER